MGLCLDTNTALFQSLRLSAHLKIRSCKFSTAVLFGTAPAPFARTFQNYLTDFYAVRGLLGFWLGLCQLPWLPGAT